MGVEINQNWVLMSNFSATVYWSVVYSWLAGIPYRGKGFATATSPWGANPPFYVPAALWVVAHTTHFTEAGTSCLLNGTGSGHIGDGRVLT